MQRYIDAEALKQDLIKRGLFPAIVKQAIEEAPAADVAPKCVYSYDGETMEYCAQTPCPNYKTDEEIRAEVAREIFAEIEKHLIFNRYGIATISEKTFDELKQKYGVE